MKRLAIMGARLWLVPAVVIGWELATRAAGNPYFVPPSTIVADMHTLWFSGPASHLWLNHDAITNLLPSVQRLLGGWAAAALLGIALGIAAGRSVVVSDFIEPVIHLGRAIPPPALVPVFLVLFRIGTRMELATIMFSVIWPVLLNSIDGARYVDRLHIDTARAFGVRRIQRLLRIILPAAAPKIFAGLRLSLSLALIIMVISEFLGTTSGIGHELELTRDTFDIPVMWAVIVVLGILGLALNVTFLLVERHVLAWHRGSRQAV